MNAALESYRNQVCGLPELEDHWFPEALTRARQGDDEARRRILGCGLKTALQIAEEEREEKDLETLDLVEEANRGLTKALTTFQGSTAEEFLRHATGTIRTHIQRHTTQA